MAGAPAARRSTLGVHGRRAAERRSVGQPEESFAALATRPRRRGLTRGASAGAPEIANQVFLGVPWKTVRPKYERVVSKLRTKYPLSFVIVGRGDKQDAQDLFTVIKERILSSSYAVFDATGENANVSLEFGFAEANEVPRAIYLSTHAAARKAKDAPIIADLAGKTQNRYTQERRLLQLLSEFCHKHPYTIRFERFLQSNFRSRGKGAKKRSRALALKVVHMMDGTGEVRRADIVAQLQADPSRYSADEVDEMIRRLHNARLVQSIQGPYSRVHIT